MKKTLLPLLLLGGFTSIAQVNHYTLFKKAAPSKHSQFVNSLLARQSQIGGTAQKPTGTQQRVIAQSSISAGETTPDDTLRYTYSGTRGSKYNYNEVENSGYNTAFTSDFLTGSYGALVSNSANLLADSIITYYDGAAPEISKAFYRTDNKLDSFFNFYNNGGTYVTVKTKQLFNTNGTMSQFVILNNGMNPPNMDTNERRRFWYNTAGTQLVVDTIYQQETNGLEPYYATKYHYNAQNNLDSIQQFENNGAGYDLYNMTTIKYDASNRVTNVLNIDFSNGTPDIITDSIAYTGSLPFFTFYQSIEGDYRLKVTKTIGANNLPDTMKAFFMETGFPEEANFIKYHYNSYNNPDSLMGFTSNGDFLGRMNFYYETYNDNTTPSAINDIKNNKNLSVFPNPFDNNINIDWKGKTASKSKISLVNIVGQNIFSTTKTLVTGNNSIDLPALTNGQYVLLIQDENGNTWSQKLIRK